MSTPFANLAACDCGGDLVFDAARAGDTCGGLAVVGAQVCVACDRAYLCAGTVAAESSAWTLNKGGRSVDTGKIRLRAEGRGEVERLMARVVRLPDLERALKRIAAGEDGAAAIAAAALAVGEVPTVEPVEAEEQAVMPW